MQSTILVIIPTWAFAISHPPSADSAKINIISTKGKRKTQQGVLKQPVATTDFFVISFGSQIL